MASFTLPIDPHSFRAICTKDKSIRSVLHWSWSMSVSGGQSPLSCEQMVAAFDKEYRQLISDIKP